MSRLTAVFLTTCGALATIALACSGQSGKGVGSAPVQSSFTLFVTTELRGNIEPCGCTSDPMGDLARTAAMISKARAGANAVIYVDGGSTLYQTIEVPPLLEAQETMKAKLIVDAFRDHLRPDAVGLGPNDLSKGVGAIRPARQVANVPASSGVPIEAPKVIEAGGVKVGLFGVVSPEAVSALGIEASDPIAAAKEAVATLRKNGARVIVGLAHMTRRAAVELARSVPGIDVIVIGQNAPEPEGVKRAPTRIGDTWLVRPANRGQVVTRLDITVRGEGPLADAIGEARAAHEIEALNERLVKLRSQLETWSADPSADPEFVATKKREVTEIEKEIAELKTNPLRVPKTGSWFVMTQVDIKKGLACDKTIQDAKVAYDKAVGDANVKAAANVKPKPIPTGGAGYMGIEECSFCHKEAVDFWKTTKHASAWKTLETISKQFNYDCIKCHVTGWDMPGGSTLSHNEELRDVQCEICHGPGSLHVDADGNDKPTTMVLAPPQDRCVTCHNEDHSDTFDYDPYLRDITGPGHGEAFRKKLGEGPTGLELRSAALKKAGASIGEGCIK